MGKPNQRERKTEEKTRGRVTYQERRQKRSQRRKREEKSEQAAWLSVRSVTGLKLRLRAGQWGGDEQQRSADWSEPLSAGRQGGGRAAERPLGAPCVMRHLAKQRTCGAREALIKKSHPKMNSLQTSLVYLAADQRKAFQHRPAAQLHRHEHLHRKKTTTPKQLLFIEFI